MIRVGMDASHIPHDEWWSIARVLRNIDSNYVAGHFGNGEWVQIQKPWF